MRVLGLNAYTHDAGVALVEDGRSLFVLEEERLNRIRKTTAFPARGLAYLRHHLHLRLRDVDEVALPWRAGRFLMTAGKQVVRGLPQGLNLLRPGASPNMNVAAAFKFLRVGTELARDFEEASRPRVRHVSHHLAHACNAFFLSPFDSAAVVVMDAYGDDCSTSVYHATGGRLRLVGKNRFFDSLGIVYSMITKYLGFRTILDEGTVMALASYGTEELCPELREVITLLPNGRFAVARRFFDYHRYGELRPVSLEFLRRFGPARRPGEPITQRHMDIAHALQRLTEETVLHVARWARDSTGERNLCFGGGVALSCLTNARLAREAGFGRMFVSPNPNDAGVALGAALAVHHGLHEDGGTRRARREACMDPYLGPEYDDAEIAGALRRANLVHQTRDDVAEVVARDLAEGRIVGWFQGRGEMGPRALGNRSILGDARDPFLRDALNEQVKHRAWFRPYAPAVLAERAHEFFHLSGPSPYMSFAVPVRSDRRDLIPAVVARDGSARVQTLEQEQNPLFHRLIVSFHRLTGVPVVLNTSFNAQEPVVCTPDDAVRLFMNSGLEVLAIGRHVVRKRLQERATPRTRLPLEALAHRTG